MEVLVPYMVGAAPLPESPATVLVAVEHVGLRFNLTRTLLQEGIFTTLLRNGDCAARLVGESPNFREAPLAVVAQCKSAQGVRRLLARVEEMGWDAGILYLIETPAEVRAEVRRAGAVMLDGDVVSEELKDDILENAA